MTTYEEVVDGLVKGRTYPELCDGALYFLGRTQALVPTEQRTYVELSISMSYGSDVLQHDAFLRGLSEGQAWRETSVWQSNERAARTNIDTAVAEAVREAEYRTSWKVRSELSEWEGNVRRWAKGQKEKRRVWQAKGYRDGSGRTRRRLLSMSVEDLLAERSKFINNETTDETESL